LKISIVVTFKKDVLDPQGKVISQTLKNMGYNNIINVRQGKFFEIELNETDKEKAKKIVEEICKKLLTNVVIEDYTINFK
jgi:phosphoribosylformylglycinamidine synthase|tara:strand:+ start:270 stop:509 length:240 start_codon:yes stop_codon:yes gene_type:complete